MRSSLVPGEAWMTVPMVHLRRDTTGVDPGTVEILITMVSLSVSTIVNHHEPCRKKTVFMQSDLSLTWPRGYKTFFPAKLN